MSTHVQHLFDSIAPRYDLVNSVLSLNRDQSWRNEGVTGLADCRFQNVLDLCAGTLSLTKALLKRNPAATITAVDFSKEMLETGRKRLTADEAKRVTLVPGDALALPFPDHHFDGVMCAYGMRNLSDNTRGLQEIWRVLRPGGRVVILDFFQADRWMTRLFQATYGKVIVPWIGGLITRDKQAYDHLRDSMRGFYTPTAYRELMNSAGFKEIRLKRQSGGISYQVTGVKP